MEAAYLKARIEDVRSYEGAAAQAKLGAGEQRSALLAALAGLGLPEQEYVRDPSRPREALYLHRDGAGRHDLGVAPWRFARHAPPRMPPADVRGVAREVRRGLVGSLAGVAAATTLALVSHLFVTRFAAPAQGAANLSPAAYLQAAPAILGCVAVLCGLAAAWYLLVFLFPRAALVSDAESREAWSRAGPGIEAPGHAQRKER